MDGMEGGERGRREAEKGAKNNEMRAYEKDCFAAVFKP